MYFWDTSALADGTYYLYAEISQPLNDTIYIYADAIITINHQLQSYIDYSAALNNYGSFYNAPNYPSINAFAALTADGSIKAWGHAGSGAPTDSGYEQIYSSGGAFAALTADGSIKAWGE